MEHHCHPVRPCCLGFAVGVVFALGMLVLAVGAMNDWGLAMLNVLASVYIGYEASWTGALVGAGWGLLDGFITGFLVGWFYEMGCCFCHMCCKKTNGGENKPGACCSH